MVVASRVASLCAPMPFSRRIDIFSYYSTRVGGHVFFSWGREFLKRKKREKTLGNSMALPIPRPRRGPKERRSEEQTDQKLGSFRIPRTPSMLLYVSAWAKTGDHVEPLGLTTLVDERPRGWDKTET